jgi:tetratricopeptide (TPR) repeat protein
VLLGVVACISLAACTSKAQRIESGLRKGAQYVAQSDWDRASVEARNVLQIDPKSADAILIVAQIADGKGALRNAFAGYSKVLETKPGSVDARLGLARLYLLSGDLKPADDQIGAVLALDAQNVRAQTLAAASLARHGDKDAALAAANRIAAAEQPLPIDSALALSGLFFNAKALDTALGVLDKSIAAHPQEIRLLQMAAEIAQFGKPDSAHVARADSYYASATAAAPKDDALWTGWASLYVHAGDNAHAEAVLRNAIANDPDDPARHIALLKFTVAFGDKARGEKDLLAAIQAHPKATDLRFAQADLYRDQKRPDEAAKVLQAIIDAAKATPAGATARGQLAALWMAQGKADEARALLAELLKANPRDATGVVLRGRLELAAGDFPAAIADFRAAAKDRPGSLDVAELLARAHRLAGEPQLAREALADAVKFNERDARAHLMLAGDMAQTKEYSSAQSEVDAAIKADPQNLPARQMKVDLALVSSDFALAEAQAREIETAFPANPTGHLMHGRVLQLQKKIPAALAQFDAAATLAPDAPEPRIAAVGLLTAQRRYGEAAARIDAIQKANANSALAREMRGELALAKGDLTGAQESFKQLVELPGAPPSAYKNLAAVMVAHKDLAGALTVLDQGEKTWPQDVVLPAARAEWLGRAGRTDEAIAVYEQILRRAPNDETVANNLAYVLAQTRRDKPSLDRALQLASRFASSAQPNYIDTLGLVQYRLGHYDQAATQLARAASLAPEDAGVHLHYGMALVRKGDVAQGGEIVRKALAGKTPLPDHDEAQALLARS